MHSRNARPDEKFILRINTGITQSTNATASNLPGPGRNIGRLFNWLGGRLEFMVNKQATQLASKPREIAEEIRTMRQTSIAEESTGCWEFSYDEERKLEKYVKMLFKQTKSLMPTTRQVAWSEIIRLGNGDEIIRSIIWTHLVKTPVPEEILGGKRASTHDANIDTHPVEKNSISYKLHGDELEEKNEMAKTEKSFIHLVQNYESTNLRKHGTAEVSETNVQTPDSLIDQSNSLNSKNDENVHRDVDRGSITEKTHSDAAPESRVDLAWPEGTIRLHVYCDSGRNSVSTEDERTTTKNNAERFTRDLNADSKSIEKWLNEAFEKQPYRFCELNPPSRVPSSTHADKNVQATVEERNAEYALDYYLQPWIRYEIHSIGNLNYSQFISAHAMGLAYALGNGWKSTPSFIN
ncbi:hypothetical protein SCHPADRAFT_986440 [Schizopora paradoxa]|uniref:Uncharacterized protein n=1 Tax=Schizopora paradoxa TaxID=27342 RepID=A0A0H2RNP9_9AGAM|nr:hypothetical protein SCHPADRAFT_986440 [Schizopora paradoxa]